MGFLAIFGSPFGVGYKTGYGEYIEKKVGRQAEKFEIF
jgi:hypothetical protein